jgi:hypothetical protein
MVAVVCSAGAQFRHAAPKLQAIQGGAAAVGGPGELFGEGAGVGTTGNMLDKIVKQEAWGANRGRSSEAKPWKP